MNEHDKAVATLIPEPANPIEFFLQKAVREVSALLQNDNECYVEFSKADGLCYEDTILAAARLGTMLESRGWSVDIDINSINNHYRWVKMWIEA